MSLFYFGIGTLISLIMHQCKTNPQRTASYPFVHYSALFLCTFSVFHCGNLYFFMLHFFHFAFSSYSTFFILHHFHVALFCVLRSFYVLLYFMLNFYMLQCFRLAFFSRVTRGGGGLPSPFLEIGKSALTLEKMP